MQNLVNVLQRPPLPLSIGLQMPGILRQLVWIGSDLPGIAVRQSFQIIDRLGR
ncbi:hypothetical protein [Bradyrhizobium sp. AS23.2]|uniref:hypothetical protein n=1 Tax=Bradyrhizobium sp. AS23.2 TaxID=1680155 RepID=UPI001431E82D|nr:hypothetical protein [Bradyrhizobium sp. AS23.2]